MSPEDQEILKRSLKLGEENNKMLRSIYRTMRWAQFWGFMKILLIVAPLVIGYIILRPHLGSISDTISTSSENLKNVSELLNQFK